MPFIFETQLVDQIPSLRRYARALTANTALADDLVQDTLERALHKKSLWQRRNQLRPWLFTIMHNVFANQVRKQKAIPVTVELDESVPDNTNKPESLWQIRELQNAVEHLPEDQRQVFLLVSLEGFSYGEVAQIMDIPVGTVMSRLSRAREHLREQLSTKQTSILRRVK